MAATSHNSTARSAPSLSLLFFLSVLWPLGCGDDTGNGGSGAGGDGGNGGADGGGGTNNGGAPDGGGPTGGAPDGGGPAGGGGSGGGTGELSISSVAPATPSTFLYPFDATPDPDGAVVYFTAYDDAGDAAIFKRNADGSGTAEVIHAGFPLAAPVGITTSLNGSSLFVADVAASSDDNDPIASKGVVFTVSAGGGTPTGNQATEGFQPRGIAAVNLGNGEQVIFTGIDPEGVPGVFSLSGTTLIAGPPFIDPSGVTADSLGRLYVADTQGGAGEAKIFVVDDDDVTILVDGLTVGHPAGLALSADSSTLLVSGIDTTTHAATLFVVDVSSGDVTTFATDISDNDDIGGIHRAQDTDTFALVGVSSGNGGAIYRVIID